MLKKEFKELYADYNNISLKKASDDVEEFLETMKDAFKTYPKIVFRGFGTFETKKTKERKIVDPRGNGEIIHAKSRKYIKFKVSKNTEKILYNK